jgi:hypothetical protein
LLDMSSRRAGVAALVFSLAGVTLMLLLVSLAARTGPSGIIHGTSVDPSIHLAIPTDTSSTQSSSQPVHHDDGLPRGSSHPWPPVIGVLIKLVVGAYLLVLLFRGLRKAVRAWQERQRPEPPPQAIDFDVLDDDPEQVVEQIRQDADDQFEALLGGSPRNAIVACWDRFEAQAERVNAARRPWETPTEFTLRLLAAVSADSAAVQGLAALYQEARFSEHPMDESSRQAAVEALDAIHVSLGIQRGVRR